MARIDSVQSGGDRASGPASGAGSSASAELTRCENQLSEWVLCPSSKTSAGKAKIAEIASKIEVIKAQIKKTEETKVTTPVAAPAAPENAPGRLRFDGLGIWVDTTA